MARTALTVQTIALAGTTVTYAAATTDGHYIPAGDVGDVFLEVKNGSAGAVNVTIPGTGKLEGQAVSDLVVSVAAGSAKHITKLSAAAFGQTDGYVYINYASTGSMTVAAFKHA